MCVVVGVCVCVCVCVGGVTPPKLCVVHPKTFEGELLISESLDTLLT